MAALQIIGVPQSNFVRVVRMAAHEKGVPYEFIPAAPHSPEVKEIHPAGKIPVMRHGDVTLFESRAIAHYIDEHFDGPALSLGDKHDDAKVEQWISYVTTVTDQLLVRRYLFAYVFPKTADKKPDRALIDELLPRLAVHNHGIAVELASIPEHIRGYGHVKDRHLKAAKAKEAELVASYRAARPAEVPQAIPVAA